MRNFKTVSKNHLKPDLDIDNIDVYLPRGIEALKKAKSNPRGFFRIFQRYEGARFFGREEYLFGLMSVIQKLAPKLSAEKICEKITVFSVPEGYPLKKHETAMTFEGPGRLLLPNETLLCYLSVGTRFRTLAAEYKDKPWVFMGARYLLPKEELAICMAALSEEGIIGTVKKYSDSVIGTESHSQETLAGAYRLSSKEERVIKKYSKNNEGLTATIRATIAFANANPDVKVYVLGDYVCRSIGCAETFIAAIRACEELGIKVAGGRIDISKMDLNNEHIFDAEVKKEKVIPVLSYGTNPYIVQLTRRKLNSAGYPDFEIVATSGIKLETIDNFVCSGASFTGIGENAAYYLNKGECNFTSDCVGYWKKGIFYPMAKEGRELWRVMPSEEFEKINRQKIKNIKIHEQLEKIDLINYLR